VPEYDDFDRTSADGESDTEFVASPAEESAEDAPVAESAPVAEAVSVDVTAAVGDTPAGDDDEDPVAQLRAALRFAPGDWFVVHSYAGYENKVKTNLETRITSLDMEDFIYQVEE
jgi:transcriptional antiterminator NusG